MLLDMDVIHPLLFNMSIEAKQVKSKSDIWLHAYETEQLKPLPWQDKFREALRAYASEVCFEDLALDSPGNVVFRRAEPSTLLSWCVTENGTLLQTDAFHLSSETDRDYADCMNIGMTPARFLLALQRGHDYQMPLKSLWNLEMVQLVGREMLRICGPCQVDQRGIPLQWMWDTAPIVQAVQALKSDAETLKLFQQTWK